MPNAEGAKPPTPPADETSEKEEEDEEEDEEGEEDDEAAAEDDEEAAEDEEAEGEGEEGGDEEEDMGGGAGSQEIVVLTYSDLYRKQGPADKDDVSRFPSSAFVPVLLPDDEEDCAVPWRGFTVKVDGAHLLLGSKSKPEDVAKVSEVMDKLHLSPEELKQHALSIAGGSGGVAAAMVGLWGCTFSLRARREFFIFMLALTLCKKDTYAKGNPWRTLPGSAARAKRAFALAQWLSKAFNDDKVFRGRLEDTVTNARKSMLGLGLDFLQRAHMGAHDHAPTALDASFYAACMEGLGDNVPDWIEEIREDEGTPASTRMLQLRGTGNEAGLESGFLELIMQDVPVSHAPIDYNPLKYLVPLVLALEAEGRRKLKTLGGAFSGLSTFAPQGLDLLASTTDLPPPGLFFLAALILAHWVRLRDAAEDEDAPAFSAASFKAQLGLHEHVLLWYERLEGDLGAVHARGEGATEDDLRAIGLYRLDDDECEEARKALTGADEPPPSPAVPMATPNQRRRGAGGKQRRPKSAAAAGRGGGGEGGKRRRGEE